MNTFDTFMYGLPIEIGNKIFNYLMPSLGDHKKKMKLVCLEIHPRYSLMQTNNALEWLVATRMMFIDYDLFLKNKYA